MKKNYRRKNPEHRISSRRYETQFTINVPGFHAFTYITGDQAFERHAIAVKGAKKHLRHELRRHNKRTATSETNEYHNARKEN